jgi:uncharacterized repeat protein (TIGR04042 family)
VEKDYDLQDFLTRSRTALTIASDRVQLKYGFPCSRALGQLERIETKALKYTELPQPVVRLIKFIE